MKFLICYRNEQFFRSWFLIFLEFAPSASQFNSRVNHEIGPFAATVPLNSRDGCKSRQSNQLEFLQKRQLLFKQAALFAKQKGDIIAAKKYLLASKVVKVFFEIHEPHFLFFAFYSFSLSIFLCKIDRNFRALIQWLRHQKLGYLWI